MIQIPRALVRTCRAVFKRLARREPAVVTFEAAADGLRIRLHRTPIQAEYHHQGKYASETLGVVLGALADFEGRGEVSLDARSDGVFACWQDGGIPKEVVYDAHDTAKLLTFPIKPKRFASQDGTLLKALADASDSVAKDPTRYAIQNIQLRGRGEIIATDGRQLLTQSGFHFGWSDDVLIPACSVFGCKELQSETSVGLARSDRHVVLGTGPWTIYLPIVTEGRYPRTEDVMPSESKVATRCRFSADDAAFLARSLPRLPGQIDDELPVTIDLNGHCIVRSQGGGQSRATELILARSEVEGLPVRLKTNRNLLARALKLGFSELCVVNADTPAFCRDDRRKYVWMLLGGKDAIPPNDNALRLVSTDSRPVISPVNTLRRKAMRCTPSTNGTAKSNESQPAEKSPETDHTLLQEAQSLKDVLRGVYVHVGRLVAAIRKQKRQSQAIRSTLASLRQLQQAEALP